MGTRKRGWKLENRGNSGWRGYEVEERECRTGKKMGVEVKMREKG